MFKIIPDDKFAAPLNNRPEWRDNNPLRQAVTPSIRQHLSRFPFRAAAIPVECPNSRHHECVSLN